MPKGGSAWDIVWITFKSGVGLLAFAAAAQNWVLRRNTTLELIMFLLAGSLLVFPSLLDAPLERVTGLDIPEPGLIGLAIAVIAIFMQKIAPSAPAAPAQK